MIKTIVGFGLKTIALWLAILVGSIIGVAVLKMGAGSVGTDGPLSGEHAFLIVNLLNALILSMLATNAHTRGWKLAFLIAGTLFCVQSFMFLLEAIYFQNSLNVPIEFLFRGAVQVLIFAMVAGVVAALLWRAPVLHTPDFTSTRSMWVRILIVSVLYMIAYFLAGFYIAWARPDVQAYYGFGENIALVPLLVFQLFRGALWALLAWWIVSTLKGSLISRALMIGVAFSILGIAPLLYPNAFMPWAVRLPHMIEIGISNLLFGIAAGAIMQITPRQQPVLHR